MKIREGFVSNSSSSSFIILKSALTKEQIQDVKRFRPAVNPEYFDGEYYIEEGKNVVHGSGDWCWDEEMKKYFIEEIGVPEDAFEWFDG